MVPGWGESVLVGVDATLPSAHAARAGALVARAAGVAAHLLHVTPDAWDIVPGPTTLAVDFEALNTAARTGARDLVAQALSEYLAGAVADSIAVRSGRAVPVLREAARELDAGLVVVGGKQHSVLGRWMGGSTAHALACRLDVPLMVVTAPGPIQRILAAVDLSEAAGPTIRAAEALAELLGASLRVLHAVQSVPAFSPMPLLHLSDEEMLDRTLDHLEQHIWPLVSLRETVTTVRRGSAPQAIADEAREAGSDLIVLGSHGKGWVDRILMGSVTERMLSALPASMMIVPVTGHMDRRHSSGGRTALALR